MSTKDTILIAILPADIPPTKVEINKVTKNISKPNKTEYKLFYLM
jgi:hypothetical protein